MPPTCLLIRPARFAHHPEAAATNAYARTPDADPDAIAARARGEADALVAALMTAGVEVLALDERDKPGPSCPDAVFPNNWFSLHTAHAQRILVLYPMHHEARRRERWGDLSERLDAAGVRIDRVIDLTHHEQYGAALEGTGSLVFDDAQPVVFAARSARTDERLARELASELGVEPVLFCAHDKAGHPIYHTNVLMTIARHFAILCTARIADPGERGRVSAAIAAPGRTLVDITPGQMDRFCANAIALPTATGGTVLAMSTTARDAFTPDQRRELERHATLVAAPIPTIEDVGGGSVRCMIATL